MELIMENYQNIDEKIRYEQALKQVKKIKGFYTHAAVYVVINIIIVIANFQNLNIGESYFQWKNFSTAIFWGVGLLAHGLSTFGPNWFLGKNWEENKIKEYMEVEKENKNRWE